MSKEKAFDLIMTVMMALWLHVSPLIVPFLIIGIFDAIDFYTGVRASRKQGEIFTMSNAMSRTHDKLTWQGAALIVAHILEFYFFKELPLFKATMFGLIWIEGQSIREKIKILSGKDILKEPFNMIKRSRK